MNNIILQIAKPEDMQAVAVILFKNGYTVRMKKTKNTSGRAVTYLVVEKDGNNE